MKKYLKGALVALIMPVLMANGACDKVTGGAETPAQVVFALKSRYEVALIAANKYEDFKRCTVVPKTTPCSDPEVVQAIRRADNAVKLAMDAAERVVRDPNALKSTKDLVIASARESLSALTVLIADYI